jgi:hypothetical protein
MATINQITKLLNEFTEELYKESVIENNLPKRKLFDSFVDNFIKKKVENKRKSFKKEITSQEVLDLKIEYENVIGKKPKGPKANDMGWLQSKIDEVKKETNINSSSSDEKRQVDDKIVKKVNDSKIKKIISINDKQINLDLGFIDKDGFGNSSFKKLSPIKGLNPLELDLDNSLEEFKYEGIIYTKKCIICYDDSERWFVFNEDNDKVGEWIDKDDGHIEWNDECWKDIHLDDENYKNEDLYDSDNSDNSDNDNNLLDKD